MNEARDENRDFWDRETQNNPIRTEMYRFGKRMQRLIEGTERSQMLVGPSGCGKDTAIYPALDAAGVGYRRIVDVTSKGLKEELHDCASLGIVAVMNDADAAIWRNEATIEILMRATGDDAGRIDMISNMKVQKHYSYVGGRIIIISNRSPFEEGVTSSRICEYKLKPLFRRMKLSVIKATQEERFAFTCYLIICENVLRPLGYSANAVNEVLDTLAINRHRVDDVSLGMVKNMLVEYVRSNQDEIDNWHSEFESWCNKGQPELPSDLPRIPKLVGAERSKRKGSGPYAKANLAPRSASDLAHELAEKLWSLPQRESLHDNAADLGYLAGLLQEYQRHYPSTPFSDGMALARKRSIA